MSVTHERPAATGSWPAQEYPSWTGPGGPGGPGGMAEPGGEPPRRRRWGLVIATSVGLATAAVAGGIAWASVSGQPGSTTGPQASRALTTAQVAATADPAAVDVVSRLGYSRGTLAGTGLVLTSTGEVLTNNHVIEGAVSIKVTDVGNGRTYKAVVVGYDEKDDIAVLQLQHASGLKTAALGDSSAVKAGDKVVGIGNADGRGGRPSAVAGKVTALGQSITATDEAAGTSEHLTGLIRTSANIQAGDSGGPLVNSQGRVVGIDTAASSRYQFAAQTAHTQAYAIPINRAISIVDKIEAGRSSATVHIGATAFLGVGLLPSAAGFPGSTGTGATVVGVAAGSPAARAGLTAGDGRA